MMKTGYIYMITNKVNGKKYIGQTIDLNRRRSEHKRRNRTAIEKAISKYGEEMFKFEIIEKTSIDNLNDKEKYWIEEYNTYKGYGYNCHIGGDIQHNENNPMYGRTGEKNPFYGQKHTQKTKEKMSRNHADVSGKNNPFYGYEYEEGEHPSITTNKRLSIKIIKDKYENNLTLNELEEKYNFAMQTISQIINGRHWTTNDIVRPKYLEKNHQGRNNINKKTKEKMSKNHADVSGINNPKAKVTKNMALKIIKQYNNTNVTYKDLAAKYNLHKCTIGRIINKRHWATKKL